MELIQPAEVKRDEFGAWSHPDLPQFAGSDEAPPDAIEWKDWIAAQGLQYSVSLLDEEDETHPVYQSYFEADDPDPNFSAWNPAPPDGDGWFLLAIDDTDDGPAAFFVRRVSTGAA